MPDIRLSTSDLLNNPIKAAPAEHSDANLASQCWQWMDEHKAGIGTAVGLAALAAGGAVAWRFMANRVAQGAENVVASNAPNKTLETLAAARRALAKSRSLSTFDAETAFSGGGGRTALRSQAEMDAVIARMTAGRGAGAGNNAAQLSGFQTVLRDLAAGGRAPVPAGAPMEGAQIGMYEGSYRAPITDAERLLHATHDGGAFHAGTVNDDLMRDLLGVDPANGSRSFMDQTLFDMRRAESDTATTFSRQMPALRFEMPALGVRKKI